MRPIRRPHRRRRLARPGAPSPSPEQEIPEGIPVDPQDPNESTLIDQTAVAEPVPVSPSSKTAVIERPAPKEPPQDETVAVAALREPQPSDSKAETAGVLDGELEPPAPEKLDFDCACGEKVTATRKTYDTRMRCEGCKALMLVSLVYDPETRTHEIVPFQVGGLP